MAWESQQMFQVLVSATHVGNPQAALSPWCLASARLRPCSPGHLGSASVDDLSLCITFQVNIKKQDHLSHNFLT